MFTCLGCVPPVSGVTLCPIAKLLQCPSRLQGVWDGVRVKGVFMGRVIEQEHTVYICLDFFTSCLCNHFPNHGLLFSPCSSPHPLLHTPLSSLTPITPHSSLAVRTEADLSHGGKVAVASSQHMWPARKEGRDMRANCRHTQGMKMMQELLHCKTQTCQQPLTLHT